MRLSAEEIEAIRGRISYYSSTWGDIGTAHTDRRALLAECDRLREGVKLAREWMRWDDIHEYAQAETAGVKTVQAREKFRIWNEANK